jgi:hypothetical protein
MNKDSIVHVRTGHKSGLRATRAALDAWMRTVL